LPRDARAGHKLAEHGKSLHGKLVNDLVRVGNHLQFEKTLFQGWQKLYGKSVALCAPGMFVARLTRIVAKIGAHCSKLLPPTPGFLSTVTAIRPLSKNRCRRPGITVPEA
jgi:hypothetical protein